MKILLSKFEQNHIPLIVKQYDLPNVDKLFIEKWTVNNDINPHTGRKIKKNGRIWRKLNFHFQHEKRKLKYLDNPDLYYIKRSKDDQKKMYQYICDVVIKLRYGESYVHMHPHIDGCIKLRIVNDHKINHNGTKCNICYTDLIMEYNREECHMCSNWNSCGRDCRMSAIICQNHGVLRKMN
jgi:hypothetical protein